MRSLLLVLVMSATSQGAVAALDWPPASEHETAGASASGMPVVLTPARLRQPQSEVPASVTVIDRSLIKASGAREIYQLFRLVPGMAALNVDGNVPTVAYHPTQARDTRRMLVLVDGRSVYQPGLSRVLWNDIPLEVEDIERIEVTRGPNAAAYGANAFTGIINIISRHPEDVIGTTVSARGGNNGVRDVRLTDGRRWSGGGLRLTAARRADEGYDDDILYLGRPLRDARDVHTFNLRLAHHLNLRDTLEVFAGGARTALQRPVDAGLLTFVDYTRLPEEDNRSGFLQLRWSREMSDQHQLRVQAYGQYTRAGTSQGVCTLDPLTGLPGPGGGVFYSRELRDLYEANNRDLDATLAAFPTDPAVINRYGILAGSGASPFCHGLGVEVEEQRADLEIEDTLQLHRRVRLVSGANVRQDRARSQVFLRGTHQNNSQALFSNLELMPLDPVRVNLGGFYQWDEINGSEFSPRAALIWTPAPGHGVRLVYSRAVRSVDIYEDQADSSIQPERLPADYRQNAVALLGWAQPELFLTQRSDGKLKSERIRSRELGYFGRMGQFEIDVRFFNEHLTDLISRPVNPFQFEAGNADKVDHRGWETQLAWWPHRRHLLRLTAARVLTEASTGFERRLIARNSGSLLWRYDFADGWLFSSAYYLAKDYNDYRYEQATAQLAKRYHLGPTELELRAMIEHNLSGDPVVFDENLYRDNSRYWFAVALNF